MMLWSASIANSTGTVLQHVYVTAGNLIEAHDKALDYGKKRWLNETVSITSVIRLDGRVIR